MCYTHLTDIASLIWNGTSRKMDGLSYEKLGPIVSQVFIYTFIHRHVASLYFTVNYHAM